MKRRKIKTSIVYSVLLCLMMALLCTGCKKSDDLGEDDYIGTWKTTFESDQDTVSAKKGDMITCTLEIYKGGNGKIIFENNGNEYGNSAMKWELSSDGEVLSIEYGGVSEGFEYNKKDNTLIRQSYRDQIFEKQ